MVAFIKCPKNLRKRDKQVLFLLPSPEVRPKSCRWKQQEGGVCHDES